jgi:hypothetical protein
MMYDIPKPEGEYTQPMDSLTRFIDQCRRELYGPGGPPSRRIDPIDQQWRMARDKREATSLERVLAQK